MPLLTLTPARPSGMRETTPTHKTDNTTQYERLSRIAETASKHPGKFTDEEIRPEDVKTIMEAALMAPSSKRSLSWEFVLVEDKDTLERLSLCKDNGAKLIAGAKLAVVVLGDPMKSDVWIEDASIASTLI